MAAGCRIQLPFNPPLVLHYQKTDPATNVPVGALDARADIPAGQGLSLASILDGESQEATATVPAQSAR